MSRFLNAQLDYILFFYGLAFFLLAAVCWGLARDRDRLLPWMWLGLFGLTNGVNEWLAHAGREPRQQHRVHGRPLDSDGPQFPLPSRVRTRRPERARRAGARPLGADRPGGRGGPGCVGRAARPRRRHALRPGAGRRVGLSLRAASSGGYACCRAKETPPAGPWAPRHWRWPSTRWRRAWWCQRRRSHRQCG